jgi:dTDP-glucose 4,6-dehydratase
VDQPRGGEADLLAARRQAPPRATASPTPRRSSSSPDRPGHDRRYAIDCAKIQARARLEPAESFETGLAKTVDWYIANRAWCAEITAKRYARERLGKSA